MPRRRLRAVAALSAAAGLATAAPAQAAPMTSSCQAADVKVTPLQGPLFYIDSDPQLQYRSSYFGYDIENLGSTGVTGLWVRLENFEGPAAGVDVVGPADGAASTKASPVAPLQAGESEPSYTYLTATAETLDDQQHDVVVYAGRPGAGGTEVCRETQVVTQVADVIKAAANKVTSSSISSPSPSLGGAFELTVHGQTGTIGSGFADDPNAVRFSPAVGQSWPSSAFRLIGVEHELPLGSPFVDRLGRNGLASASEDYRVTYRFRVVGPTGSPTPILPVSNISSGTQVKHTDPGSFANLAPIPVVVNNTTLAVSAPAPGSYAAGDTVPVTATLTNGGDGPVDVDAIRVTLPAGWTAVAGSAERDGQPIADPHTAGQELQLVGPFTVPDAGENSAGTSTFTFDLLAVAQPGTLTASGTLDGGTIDSTQDADDDAPASVLLSVEPAGETPVDPPVETPAGPDAQPVETSGVGTAQHTGSLTVPSGGSIHLLDADGVEVEELVVPDVGTYTVEPATGAVAFSPVLGFSGAAPAISWIVRDADDRSDVATWVATVSKPAGPAAQDADSEDTGVTPQVRTIVVPEGGSIALLNGGGQETNELAVEGVGTYTLVPQTGEVTFVPVLGFHGVPEAVPFRIVDAYGQADEGVYTPRVLVPPLAPAAPRATSGEPGDPQSHVVVLPAGGRLALLDAGGDPVAELVVAGVGTFRVGVDGVSITFVPESGFTGEAPPVTYAISDAYGQRTTSTYVAEVRAPDAVDPPVVTPVVQPPALVGSPLAAVLDGVGALVPERLGGVLDEQVVAPATCASRRTMRIHWLVPRGTTLRRVVVSVSGKDVQRLPGRARAVTVDFRGRPAEQLHVRIAGRTTAGKLLVAHRTYRTCVGRIAHPPLKTLRLLPGR